MSGVLLARAVSLGDPRCQGWLVTAAKRGSFSPAAALCAAALHFFTFFFASGCCLLLPHRAKKRNMERLTLACGGFAINSVEELSPDCLVRFVLSSTATACVAPGGACGSLVHSIAGA